jgi:hypothetical protein
VTFVIVGRYRGGKSEVIDHAEGRKEAAYLIGEYRLAFGPEWTLTLRHARPSDELDAIEGDSENPRPRSRWNVKVVRQGKVVEWRTPLMSHDDPLGAAMEVAQQEGVQVGDSLTVYSTTPPTTSYATFMVAKTTAGLPTIVEVWTRGGGNPPKEARAMSVPERHQLRIARDTLRMADPIARVMGGMTKDEARAVIRRLTGRVSRENPGTSMTWHVYAGGTGAAEGKRGYATYTDIGEYHVWPVSSTSGRHLGYDAWFANTKGKLPGGLWQPLGRFRSPNEGKQAVRDHHEANTQ